MAESRVAAVIVRNTASHDARVLRCARALRGLGYETVVVAVTSSEERAEHAVEQGMPIVRLTPRAPLGGLAGRLRGRKRSAPAIGTNTPVATPGEAPARDRAWAALVARPYRLLRTLSYYRRGIAAMRRLRPDLVHCNDYNTMWIGVAAKLLTGSALVYDSHELWPDRNGRTEPRWWLLACEALFLRLADKRLATSPGHAGEIARRHRVRAPLVVRNIAERPEAGDPEPAGDDGGPTLVYAGAVTTGRGLEQAVAALPLAPAVRLRLVGPGNAPYRERLRLLAAQHGVSERVRLDAAVPPDRVVGEIAAATAGLALIQPSCLSYSLSLPNKLFEYLAAGLPILAADVPTIREFAARNRVGVVVAPDDLEAIAAGMLAIVDPERNRRLREAVAEAGTRLTWERESTLLTQAYRAAVETGRRA